MEGKLLIIESGTTIDTSKYVVCDGVAWTVDLNARDLYVCNMSGDIATPDWENVLIARDVENWEGTQWNDMMPTRGQIEMVRTLVAACLNIRPAE